jgi:hypothetical protein
MKQADKNRIGLGLAVLVLCGAISQSAWSWDRGNHRHGDFHSHFGVFIGAPFFWWPPEPYYYSPYYYPPVSHVYIEEQPPVYVQRNNTPAASVSPPANYWYYCQNPQGYYPYVQNCPAGWMQVVPQPPPNQ